VRPTGAGHLLGRITGANREAFEERTRAVVTALRAEDLDEVVDAARLQQSVSDGTYSYSGPWGSSQIQARVITSNVRDRGMGQTEHVTFVPNVRKGEWHEQRAQRDRNAQPRTRSGRL
jgi:hypothetical protein